MNEKFQQLRAERQRLKEHYGDLFDEVTALLFKHDPIQICLGRNTDEYEPEVGTILPRLLTCHNSDEVHHVLIEEFAFWFGESYGQPISHRYKPIARKLWKMWGERQQQ